MRALLKSVETRHRSATTLQATFLEIYRDGSREARVESGTVYFSRPGRMRWEYEAPEKKLFLVDGKQVWFYVPADRSVMRTPVEESSDWHTPLSLLAGKANFSRFCKSIEKIGEPAARGPQAPVRAAITTLRCVPRGADLGIQEALLEVDSLHFFSRILIRETGGIETEFRFAAWQANPVLAEALFHFQAPPGVAIVEGGIPEQASRGPGR